MTSTGNSPPPLRQPSQGIDDVPGGLRYRKAAKTSITSVAVRALGLITSFVAIRLLLDHLGEERFGIWVTLSSLVAFANFADFGLGNGLLNNLSDANSKASREEALSHVSTAFSMLAVIAAVLAVLFAAAHSQVDWAEFFQVRGATAKIDLPTAVGFLSIVFLVSIPLAIGEKIELAHQTGFRYNAALGASILIAFTGIVLGIQRDAGLPFLVVAGVAPPALAGAISCLHNFFVTRPWLRPSFTKVSRQSARLIAGTGLLFLALQVSVSVAYSTDNIVITRILGAASVPQYAVPFRLFNTVQLFISLLITPLWPAYREAFVRQEHSWINRTLKRSLWVALAVSSSLAIALAVWGDAILRLWLGRDLEISTNLLIGLAIWTVMASLGSAIATFLNGTGMLRVQVVLSLLMTVANLGLSIFLCRRIGVEGAIWSTVISYTVFVLVPLTFYLPKMLKAMGSADQQSSPPPMPI